MNTAEKLTRDDWRDLRAIWLMVVCAGLLLVCGGCEVVTFRDANGNQGWGIGVLTKVSLHVEHKDTKVDYGRDVNSEAIKAAVEGATSGAIKAVKP